MHLSSLVRPQLTARPEGEKDDLATRTLSFMTTGAKDVGRFMSFGPMGKKTTDDDGDALGKMGRILSFVLVGGKKAVKKTPTTPASMIVAATGRESAAHRHTDGDFTLGAANCGIGQMADEGEIDGDAPFKEVLEGMSRQKYIEKSGSMHSEHAIAVEEEDSEAPSKEELKEAARKSAAMIEAAAPEQAVEEEESVTGGRPSVAPAEDEDSDHGRQEDTEEVLAIVEEPDPVDEPTRTSGGDAEASVVITKPEEIAPGFDSGAEEEESPTRPTMQLIQSMKSFGGSFINRMSGAEATAAASEKPADLEEASMKYGSNYDERTSTAAAAEPVEANARLSKAIGLDAATEILSPDNLLDTAGDVVEALKPENVIEALKPDNVIANVGDGIETVAEVLKPENVLNTAVTVSDTAIEVVGATAEVLSPSNLTKQASRLSGAVFPRAWYGGGASVCGPRERHPPPLRPRRRRTRRRRRRPHCCGRRRRGPCGGRGSRPEACVLPSACRKRGRSCGRAASEPEPVVEEPPPPPPKIVDDTPADSAVRTWIKAVLLGVDDLKTLTILNNRTVSIRENLRNGIILCGVLNALKPRTIGRVKVPSATATRFAKLEPLQSYLNGCHSVGLTDRDCLKPADW